MAIPVGTIEARAELDDRITPALKKIQKQGGKSTKELQKGFARIDAQALADGLERIGSGLTNFGRRADGVIKVGKSFDQLTKSAGLSGDTIIKKVRVATKGLISDYDIMLARNRAAGLGMNANADDMADYAEQAFKLSRIMGISLPEALDRLIGGMGKMEGELLEGVGLKVRAEEAYKRYADSVGKTTKELTGAEKTQAFVNETMRQARNVTSQLGEDYLTTSDHIAAYKIQLQNALDTTAAITGPIAAVGGELLTVGANLALLKVAFGTKFSAMVASAKSLLAVLGPTGLGAAFVGLLAYFDKSAVKMRQIQNIADPMARTYAELAEAQRLLAREEERYSRGLGSNEQLVAQRRREVEKLVKVYGDMVRAQQTSTEATEKETEVIRTFVEWKAEKEAKAWEKAEDVIYDYAKAVDTAQTALVPHFDLISQLPDKITYVDNSVKRQWTAWDNLSEAQRRNIKRMEEVIARQKESNIEAAKVQDINKYWDDAAKAATRYGEDIAHALMDGVPMAEALKRAFQSDAMRGMIRVSGEWMGRNLTDFLSNFMSVNMASKLAGVLSGPLAGVAAMLGTKMGQKILGSIGGIVSRIGSGIGKAAGGLWSGIKGLFGFGKKKRQTPTRRTPTIAPTLPPPTASAGNRLASGGVSLPDVGPSDFSPVHTPFESGKEVRGVRWDGAAGTHVRTQQPVKLVLKDGRVLADVMSSSLPGHLDAEGLIGGLS